MIKIEKMQPVKDNRFTGISAAIRALKVGEGFYVPSDKLKSAAAIASNTGKIEQKRFTVRRDGDRVQVCRVEDPK